MLLLKRNKTHFAFWMDQMAVRRQMGRQCGRCLSHNSLNFHGKDSRAMKLRWALLFLVLERALLFLVLERALLFLVVAMGFAVSVLEMDLAFSLEFLSRHGNGLSC